MLSCLANTNISLIDLNHSKLNKLFIYNTTFAKIHLILILQILTKYKANNYWSRL